MWYNAFSSYTEKVRQVGVHGGNRNVYEQTDKFFFYLEYRKFGSFTENAYI